MCALISYAMLAGLKNDEFDLDRYTAGQYTLRGGIVAWLFSGVLACYELARRTSKSQLSERQERSSRIRMASCSSSPTPAPLRFHR